MIDGNKIVTIFRGEIILIMRASGSGKATLLLMMGALLKPMEGTIQ
jgi:ABC-type lipoprotein export system ATPase subunit